MQNLSQPSCTVTKAETPRAADRGAARRREMVELVLDRKFGVDRLAVLGARQHLRQPVIALRPDHEIDAGARRTISSPSACATQPATAIEHAAAVVRGRLLQHAHAAELGIDLLGRLLADVAGVEDDEVGVVGRRGLDEALGRQRVRHTMRIVDVHLAAVGFDVELAGSGHAVRVGRRPANFIKLIKRFSQPTDRRWGRARSFSHIGFAAKKKWVRRHERSREQRRSPGRTSESNDIELYDFRAVT